MTLILWTIGEVYSYDYQMVKYKYNLFERFIQECKEYDLEQIIFINDSDSKLESAVQQNLVGILNQSSNQSKQNLAEYFGS